MKKNLSGLISLVVLAYLAYSMFSAPNAPADRVQGEARATELARAFEQQQSNVQVQGQGVVTRILPDDREGSPHQRFILRLPSGQTVLVAHNLELAPRIDSLQEGDTVTFFGEYEWSSQGGTVHWTHDDPDGSHVAGWLEHQGITYQ